MFKMDSIKRLFFYLFALVMVFNQNALSKSLPPGSGTGDVKANILILLDTSASMNGNPFGGAAIYNPNDLILLDDGDVMVGQARGAMIIAAAQAGLLIYEYAPKKVKMSVCGNGGASKQQVKYMVMKLLNLKDIPGKMDISDAIAVGICCLNQVRLKWSKEL